MSKNIESSLYQAMEHSPTAHKPQEDREENVLAPHSTSLRFEQLASGHAIRLYTSLVRKDAAERLGTADQEVLDAVIDDWYCLAFSEGGRPPAGEALQHLAMLEEIRMPYAQQLDLPMEADWNHILVTAMEKFDGPIETGLEMGWSWERVLNVYYQNEHIDSAIKCGLGPEATEEEVLGQLKKQTAELRADNERLRAENERKLAELAPKMEALKERMGLPPETTYEELRGRIYNTLRSHLSELWGRDRESISDEDISDYLSDLGS